jgi:hypothetical protein
MFGGGGLLVAEAFKDRYAVAALSLLGWVPDTARMDERSVARAERHFGVALPEALRGYYLTLGNLRELNDAHNRLLAPKDWFIDGGKLVFMVENQAVVYWGVEAAKSPDDDAAVFQGVNLLPEAIEWHPECDRCSEFLLVMLHWQAVMGGLEWLGMTDEAGPTVADHLTANWQRVGGYGEMDAYCREGRAACLLTDGGGQLYVGGRTEAVFESIAEELRAVGVELDQL